MESEKLQISIIVPIYKVEEYLPECIESIMKQTYGNLEILLIDDGSPDKCGMMCDEYAMQDSRIRVFHKENGGYSEVVNYGLQYASGEYVAVVDGDDYIGNADAFRILADEAEKTQADIIVGNYQKAVDGFLIDAREHGFLEGVDTLSSDFRFRGFFSLGHLAYMWGKLYKRSFIEAYHITAKNYYYAQDKLFNVECYLRNPSYGFVPDRVYVYRTNNASVSYRYKDRFAELWMELSEEVYRAVIATESKEETLDLVAYHLLFALFFSCKQEYIQFGRQRSVIKAELKKYMKFELMRKFVRRVAGFQYLRFHNSLMWKVFLWGISLGLFLRLYGLLSWGIKLVIDLNIDGRMSSIGKSIGKSHR